MKKSIYIVTPCFNENVTLIKFIDEIVETVKNEPFSFKIIVVDDASSDETVKLVQENEIEVENVEVSIITLSYNMGHQAAIYQGLVYAKSLCAKDIIIIDSDGEDDPQVIPELCKRSNSDIVHVIRGKRKESLFFRISYRVYKSLFKLIAAKKMNMGNYCKINDKVLNIVTETNFIHFAAFLTKLKVDSTYIESDRRKRIDGKSKMSLNSLLHHAFRSFVEYADDLLLVFLKLFVMLCILFGVIIVYVIYKKLFTDSAILGWASTLSTNLFNSALICLGFFVMGILLLNILNRNNIQNNGPKFKVVIPLKNKN